MTSSVIDDPLVDVPCDCWGCLPPSADELRAQVAVAARRLDVAAPDWRSRVDRDALYMASGDRCVLGQVFDSYPAGMTALYGTTYPAEARVFGVWPPLREAWLAELDRVPTDASRDDRDLAVAGTRVTATAARTPLDELRASYVVVSAPVAPGRSALTELLVGSST